MSSTSLVSRRRSRVKAAPSVPATIEWTAFPSELGWMAALFRTDDAGGETLCELTFGHESPAAAYQRLVTPSASDAQAARREPRFVHLLQSFARGERVDLAAIQVDTEDLPPFAARVVRHCRRIPYGGTLTYRELAAKAGSPRAARAVGNVMRANRCPLVVPCHRVVPTGAGLGGYSAPGGQRVKLRLLELEGNR